MRAENGNNSFCTVLKKGSEEAGAIFIVHNRGNNLHDFYGPLPQSMIPDDQPFDRFFELLHSEISEAEVSAKIAQQLRFDPDCWAIEIENSGQLQSFNISKFD